MIFLERGCEWQTVLLHEILHAVIKLSGKASGLGLTYDGEEGLVEALEHGLAPLLFGVK